MKTQHYLTETIDLVEAQIDETAGKKQWVIEGIFLQAGIKNRNKRIYNPEVLEREVQRYVNERVRTNRAIGELNHPKTPVVNPERASHLITELRKEGNNFVGKAKILNTPMGNIVTGLLEGGVRIGVSSRGTGTLLERNGVYEVQSDYKLYCVDIVSDPSAPDALVTGIMEGAEWIVVDEEELEKTRKQLDEARKNRERQIQLLKKFFNSLH